MRYQPCTELWCGKIRDPISNTQSLGEQIYPFDHLRGGDLTENLSIFRNLLEGNASPGLLSTVLINISSALWISGKAPSIEQGMLQAKELIDSGKVMDWLKKAETFFSK